MSLHTRPSSFAGTLPEVWLGFRHMADIEAHITGNVWKITCAVGDTIEDGDEVVILESMKMEIPVESEDDGVVKEIKCAEGQSVTEGEVLVVLE
jgi:acetyl-CoA carboxylase biotin carboxyl carrier protein